ncbi:MAG: AzlD domain-containing protein [Chloroflexota bacterium]
MSELALILLMGFSLFLLRVSGFLIPRVAVAPGLERVFDLIPAALLAGLVAGNVAGSSGEIGVRSIAAAGALATVWKFPRMWLCIFSGMALYWALRLATG